MASNDAVLELRNIGNTSALWLKTIGIKSYDDLAKIGSVEAYLRIQDKGIKVSKVLLYALEGALLNIHWNEIEPTLKQQLLEQVTERLAAKAGI